MLRYFIPLALLSGLAAPAGAQDAPLAPPATVAEPAAVPPPPASLPAAEVAPTPPPAPQFATVRVTLTTSLGPIVLELEKQRAPVTTANFLRYVAEKRFDGTDFYRATKIQPGFGLIQGGVANFPKRALPGIPHEATSKTGLTHTDGTISMARTKPGTAAGDFFITIGALTSLDADPKKPGDNLGFAAFGHVVDGMDIVRRILEAPTSATKGAGVMKGQMIAAPVKIVSARRS
jgi:peptidyl-prolyl cis-trans isomerase A (cyclophilin A)